MGPRITWGRLGIAPLVFEVVRFDPGHGEGARGEENAFAAVAGRVRGHAAFGKLQQGQARVFQLQVPAHALEEADTVVSDPEVSHTAGHRASSR